MIFDLSSLTERQHDLVLDAIARTEFDFTRLATALKSVTGREQIVVKFGGADSPDLNPSDGETVLGVAWPQEGEILLNATAAEKNPLLGQEIFVHEVAHLVDELMLGASDRERIIDAVWDGEGERPGWFEGPYDHQIGELFMHLFTRAFTDLRSPERFEGEVTDEAIEVVREVLAEGRVGRRRIEEAHRARSAKRRTAA